MTAITPKVEVWFGNTETPGDVFVLDDLVKGELDDATYVLGGDLLVPSDITSNCYDISIRRGRSRELDEIQAGTCAVRLRNYDGSFLPELMSTTDPFGAGNITPGKRVRVSVYDIPIFDGIVDDWEYEFDSDLRVDAGFVAADALASLARKSFDEWTATPSQAEGARLTAILDRGEVVFGANRDLDVGAATLQGDLVTWGSNVLNYAQLVVKSGLGRLFAAADGVLTFRDRHALVDATAAVVFADDGTGIPFSGVKVSRSAELLANRVSVDREGGVAQTATNATSAAKYGVRQLSIGGLLLDSNTQSLDMANFLAGIYAEPPTRIASMQVFLDNLTVTQQTQVLALDLAHVVSVTWTPVGGSEFTQLSVVEGINHSTSFDGLHVVGLSLSPVSQTESFVLDDVVLGVLDAGVLTY